jgi:hypothetical protein
MAQRAHKGRVRGAQRRVRSLASIQVPLFCPRAGTGPRDVRHSPKSRTTRAHRNGAVADNVVIGQFAQPPGRVSQKYIWVPSGTRHAQADMECDSCAWCAAARVVRGVAAHEAVVESISARLNPTLRSRWRAPRRLAPASERIPRPVRCAAGDRRRPAPSSRRYRGAVLPGRGATPERKRSPRETP